MADDELTAMGVVYDALEPLDPPARNRVLLWVAGKLEVNAPISVRAGDERGGPAGGDDPPQFEELGDLVHSAGPSTGPERALVVAYWFQEIQGQDGWTGGDINSSLKNMGTGLANVTNTLDSLKSRKPALVMQVGKSGRSRQARKTYKLTVAGIQAVKAMIASVDETGAA